MKISNEKQIVWQRIRLTLITIVFGSVIGVFLFTFVGETPTFGLSNYMIAIFLACIYILILIVFFSLDLNFIYYKDDGKKIIFRFYSKLPFKSVKGSIEIPKNELKKVEFSKSFLGIKQYITFYQQTIQGVAKYRSVSITALTREQRRDLKTALSAYTRIK